MTKLNKQLKRKVEGVLPRPLTVTLYPGGVIGFREGKGRTEYILPLITCYKYAVLASQKDKKRTKKNDR